MPRQQVLVSSIWGGISASEYFIAPGQYGAGIAIDPEAPSSDAVGDRKSSGALRPTATEAFSGANVTASVMWLETNPKNALVYAYLANGRFVSYSSSLGSETLVDTASTSTGNGLKYYNNYYYLFRNTDINRYGPMDGSPSMATGVWTGATLGTQTALVNTTYPALRGSVAMPNHVAHVHGDNKLYFLDFISTGSSASTRGRGVVHFIKTTYGSAEGDTNDGSTYNALDLPVNMMPVDLESLSTDLVIAAIQTTSSALIQGNAKLYFWDTFADSFYNEVTLPDPLVTAVKNHNGTLYIFTGNISNGSDVSNGYRISRYLGGQTVEQVYFSETGQPPLAGAVEVIGNRLTWGTFTQLRTTTAASPEYYSVVMAIGSKDTRLPSGVHCIYNSTATGSASDGLVTALGNLQQDSLSYPKLVIGHRDADGSGIDKQSTTYSGSVQVFRYPVFVGSPFEVRRIRVPLAVNLAANMTITAKVFLDDFSRSVTCRVVNSTNFANMYSDRERYIELYPDAVTGDHNMVIEFRWTGSVLCPILLPIICDIETYGIN